MNGLNIKDPEDFKELYERDKSLAMSLLFDNIRDIKEHLKHQPKVCGKKFAPRWSMYAGLGCIILLLILIKVAVDDPAAAAQIADEAIKVIPR